MKRAIIKKNERNGKFHEAFKTNFRHMKTRNLLYIFALLAIFTTYSCSDVLDTEAKDAFAEDLIYSDVSQVERLVFTAYNSTEGWSMNRHEWWARRVNIEGASFEAKFNFKDLDLYMMRGGITASNMGVMWKDKWADYYQYIHDINSFLDRIDGSSAMSSNPDDVLVLKAEMRFLRANLYAKLVNLFGGVPIAECIRINR